jgi:pyruvate dehydrogenase E1 component beta subunit
MGEEIAGGAGREHLGIVDAWGGPFRTTVGLIQQFGNQRVLDTPLSEAAFVGTAIGAASTGMRTIAELMFVDFVGVCMDQLLNNAAKMRYMFGGQVKVPFTLLTRIGAGFGSAAQHSESYYSIFSHIPGLKGVVPSDPYTAKGLLMAAIRDDDPVVYFEHKGLYGNTGHVPEAPYTLPLGKGRTVRQGTDVTLVGISKMTLVCLEAAEELAKSGINAEVIDLLSVSPIDYDLIIDSVRRTHRVVVVDETHPSAAWLRRSAPGLPKRPSTTWTLLRRELRPHTRRSPTAAPWRISTSPTRLGLSGPSRGCWQGASPLPDPANEIGARR